MSMSRVPWSTFARCRVCLAMVDIRPPIGTDGRHSTLDLSRPEFQYYMSNDDFRRIHLSSGPVARFAAPSGLSRFGSNPVGHRADKSREVRHLVRKSSTDEMRVCRYEFRNRG